MVNYWHEAIIQVPKDWPEIQLLSWNNINVRTDVKELGVTVDHQLKFQKHIGEQVNKANQKLG